MNFPVSGPLNVESSSFHWDSARSHPRSFLLRNIFLALTLLLPASLRAEYRLTFNDEFNTYNAPRWQTSDFWGMRNNGGDFQGQWFADPAFVPAGSTLQPYQPFSTASGILTILAQPTPANIYAGAPSPNANPQPYVSGQLTTAHKFTQRYGYFEIRAKLPPGKGLWSRFWLLADDGFWPAEYDIFEVLGRENPAPIHQTTHYRDATSQHGIDGFNYFGINPFDGNFHIYGFLWEPRTVTWYVDGVATLTQTNRFHMPMYALLDLTVGNDPPGTWPGSPDATTPWPSRMEIDYFRVYSNDPSIPAVTPDAGYTPSTLPPGKVLLPSPVVAPLPSGWASQDLGSPDRTGSSAWNANTGEWMMKGAGYGLGGYGDQGRFAGAPLSGDGAVTATVQNVTAINSNAVRAGVMIRESTGGSAREIALLHITSSVSNPTTSSLVLMSRSSSNGLAVTLSSVADIPVPVTLRLVRRGNLFTAEYSRDGGIGWTAVGSPQTIAMSSTIQAGLAVGGNQNNYLRLSRAIFSNVQVGQTLSLVSPAAPSVVTGQTQSFSASLMNPMTGTAMPAGPVTWSVVEGGGTITSSGLYTAPSLAGAGTAVIKAAFGSSSATATIKVTLPGSWTLPILVKTPPADAGTSTGVWTLTGGGTGISTSGTKDSFQMLSAPLRGNQIITVKVTGSTGPQAGLIMRDSYNTREALPGLNGRYAGIWRTPTGLQWVTRETAGGNATVRQQVPTPGLPVWLRLKRVAAGSTGFGFTAFYSSDGLTWTQFGSPRTFTMDSDALAGPVVASGSTVTTASATFSDLTLTGSLTVAVPAAASVVNGLTASLSVLGDGGESGLNYTWSATGPAAVTFSVNGTNAAKATTATFSQPGSYSFLVTLTDGTGGSVTSTVNVVIDRLPSRINLSPVQATVAINAGQQFVATGLDQFGQEIPVNVAWSVVSGGGSISPTGFFTAPGTTGTGSAKVRALAGSLSAESPISLTAIDAYQAWMAQFPTISGNDRAGDADPDYDGVPNQMEYAVGGRPDLATSAPTPSVSMVNGVLQISFTRLHAELLYEVVASSDLRSWRVIDSNPGQPGLPTIVSDSAGLNANRRFIGLRVSR